MVGDVFRAFLFAHLFFPETGISMTLLQ